MHSCFKSMPKIHRSFALIHSDSDPFTQAGKDINAISQMGIQKCIPRYPIVYRIPRSPGARQSGTIALSSLC